MIFRCFFPCERLEMLYSDTWHIYVLKVSIFDILGFIMHKYGYKSTQSRVNPALKCLLRCTLWFKNLEMFSGDIWHAFGQK